MKKWLFGVFELVVLMVVIWVTAGRTQLGVRAGQGIECNAGVGAGMECNTGAGEGMEYNTGAGGGMA